MTLLSGFISIWGMTRRAYDVAAEAIKGAEKQGYKLWTNDEYAKIWLLRSIVNCCSKL